MKIVFDQGTPAPLRHQLLGHDVSTAGEMGWSALSNGDLLSAAGEAFDLLVTTDQNLRYQQNLAGRRWPSSFSRLPAGLASNVMSLWWYRR